MATEAVLQARLDAIDEALSTGELIIRHADGRSVTMRSVSEMKVQRKFVAKQLSTAQGVTPKRKAHTMIVDRGL